MEKQEKVHEIKFSFFFTQHFFSYIRDNNSWKSEPFYTSWSLHFKGSLQTTQLVFPGLQSLLDNQCLSTGDCGQLWNSFYNEIQQSAKKNSTKH